MPQASRPEHSREISLRKKGLFACVVTLGFFGLLEGLLVLGGVGLTAESADPFVGFSNQYPLFVPDESIAGNSHVRTADEKLVWFNDQRFARKKPAGVRRVFCVGGSTTFGRPYEDNTSFCGWLREFLPLVDESVQWEVINAGGVSYASYRVAAVMEELSQYDPDLFIVYTGQNEFLERRTYAALFNQSATRRNVTAALGRTRTFSVLKQLIKPDEQKTKNDDEAIELPGEVDEMLNHTVGPADYHRDDEWHADVLKQYRANLSRMAEIAKKANSQILFVVPASNEKDCSPFKSEWAASVSDNQRSQLQDMLANASEPTMIPSEALELLQSTKHIDAGHAEVDYRIGKLRFAAKSSDEARTSFQAAIDHDVCPLRATSDFQTALRTFTNEHDVMLVDFDQRLRDLCLTEHGHQILGQEYFLDHVHPTIQAHQKLSLWIIEELQRSKAVATKSLAESDVDRVYKNVLARIDRAAQGVALRNLAKVLHWAGKFAEAEPRARDALRILRDDPESLLVLADCLYQTQQTDDAIETYQRLLEVAPMYSRAYLPFGELLFDLQENQKARNVLSMAVLALPENSPGQVRAQYFLGITYIELNDFRQADSLLSNVDRHYADDPNTLIFLAQAKAGLEKTTEAIAIYERTIKLAPKETDARNRLGLLLLKEKRIVDAKRIFQSVLEIDPSDKQAAASLQIANQLLPK